MTALPGYAGQLLRVDLSARRTWTQPIDATFARTYVGGAGFGARVLYDEVAADVTWEHPDNRMILATGPFAGSVSWGTSNLCVVTRGTLSGGATSTQANGFFGHNLKFSGYDGIVLQGIADDWVYLYIEDDVVELRDARHLLGLDTWQLQDTLQAELGRSGHQLSVYGIGVSGENLVRFAAIEGDYGHVASKNGVGAVLGNKKVKAIAIVRGTKAVQVADSKALWEAADILADGLKNGVGKGTYSYGTLGGWTNLSATGGLPFKNYTTNIYPSGEVADKLTAPALRALFQHRGHQCSSCGMHHCHIMTLPSGPHAGELADEPEYEGLSGCGSTIGCTDPVGIAWLNTQVDKAGVDVNEFGWVCGWVMECMEKGWLTEEQVGFRLEWGDAEGAARLLWMIARREGFGDVLAGGVKHAAETIGGEAYKAGIFTMKGSTPRGHDHRGVKRDELLDTCLASNGTFECGMAIDAAEIGAPARVNSFDPAELTESMSKIYGRRNFEDSIGVCTFTNMVSLSKTVAVLNAITGWDFTFQDARVVGRRIGNLFRAFNLRCGIGPEAEFPSPRYGSVPVDGPAAGADAAAVWEEMRDRYYGHMGWDRATGKPFAWKLEELGLPDVARDLWALSPA